MMRRMYHARQSSPTRKRRDRGMPFVGSQTRHDNRSYPAARGPVGFVTAAAYSSPLARYSGRGMVPDS